MSTQHADEVASTELGGVGASGFMVEAGDNLDVRVHFEPALSVIRLAGVFTGGHVHVLRDAITAVSISGRPDGVIVLDLTKVTVCDDTGLSAIVEVRQIVEDAGMSLVLRGP